MNLMTQLILSIRGLSAKEDQKKVVEGRGNLLNKTKKKQS